MCMVNIEGDGGETNRRYSGDKYYMYKGCSRFCRKEAKATERTSY